MKLIKVLLSLIMLTNLCFASAYDDGMKAYQAGDIKKAVELLKQDKTVASYMKLGTIFSKQKNHEEALKWYTKAAETGDATAQTKVGNLYKRGIGTKPNDRTAAEWYYRAAKQGDITSQNNLANMYMLGQGVDKNYDKAFMLYRYAANAGSGNSMCKLGNMYQEGLGTKKDLKSALSWYQEGVNKLNGNCAYHLGMMYYEGNGIEQDKEKGMKWLKFAAKHYSAKAKAKLEMFCKDQKSKHCDKKNQK